MATVAMLNVYRSRSLVHFAIGRALVLAASLVVAACSPKGDALYLRAESAAAKGDARAAVIDLKTLLAAEPKNAKARALLGYAFVEIGDYVAGDIELQKARNLGAPPAMLLVPRCRVLVAKAKFADALAECNPDAAPPAVKTDLHVIRGNALLGLERASDAKAQFEAATAAAPDRLDAILGLATSARVVGGDAALQVVLSKVQAGVKDKSRYWLLVGGLATGTGDFVAAETAFQTALAKAGQSSGDSDKQSALGGLAEAQLRQGKLAAADTTSVQLQQAAPKSLYVKQLRGQVLAATGKFDGARTLLEEVVSAQPNNFGAHTLLGIVNLQQGNLGQAEMHFSNVVANQPSDVRAQRLLAETRSRRQTPEATLASLQPALEQTSNDPSILAMAGRLSLASGDREKALAYLAQAAAQRPQDKVPAVQLEIANTYLTAGDLERAVEVLQAMPQGGTTGYQREYMLMLTLLRQGQNDKAIAEADALLKRSGSDAAARKLVAGVYAAAGRRDLGREQFNEALKIKSSDSEALLGLARLNLAEGKTDAADKNFQAILANDPKNLIATLGAVVVADLRKDAAGAEKWLLKARTDHPQSAEAQLSVAQYYLGKREPNKATAVLDDAAKALPKSGAIAHARGLLQFSAGDIPAAKTNLTLAVQLEPQSSAFALDLARVHLASRDLPRALEVLGSLLKSQPRFVPALALAAAASLQGNDAGKAAGYLERLKKVAPDAPVTLQLEGDFAAAQKRYKQAVEFYDKADPKGADRNVVFAKFRASVLGALARPALALSKWASSHPEDAGAVMALAEWRQGSGDVAGAIRLYEQGLERAPTNAILLNNLASLYQVRGDSRALPTAEKAFDAAPKAPAILDTFGWLLVSAGKPEKAVPMLAEAAKQMPKEAEVQYHFAVALARLERTTEALPVLESALSGQLPAGVRADAQKLLGQLSK